MKTPQDIRTWMESIQDPKYHTFYSRLISEIDPKTILGIRMADLKPYVRKLSAMEKEEFIKDLPHKWHEENMLHILILNDIKDEAKAWQEYKRIQPFMKTWAMTDSLTFNKIKDDILLEWADKLMEDEETYHQRQGIIWLMKRGLKNRDHRSLIQKALQCNWKQREVYMALGWMLCEALVVNREIYWPFVFETDLPLPVLNMMVSKCRDSRRISMEDKETLKELLKSKRAAAQS